MNSFWINLAVLAGLLRLPVARFLPPVRQDAVEEAVIRVRGRYIPSVIRAQRDVPLRITFDRQEATPCSEWVVFSQPRYEVYLPAFRRTTVELLPTACGEHLFTCRMGIYQGRLIVSDGGRVPRYAGAALRALARPWTALASRRELLRAPSGQTCCDRRAAAGADPGGERDAAT